MRGVFNITTDLASAMQEEQKLEKKNKTQWTKFYDRQVIKGYAKFGFSQ
ncbi:MAG: hypothetical protein NT066_00390 [Candidatus Omnitrophica bacterium]|nr:hypothetical protein [Candidatus Omnitrophota bacterium]